MPYVDWISFTWVSNICCVYSTPLDGPVLPEVKMIAAASSALVVGSSALVAAAPCRRNSLSIIPPQNQRRPTVTFQHAWGNCLRNQSRAAWATGTATNPSGSASARQRTRFLRPSPGSTNTITTPARSSANTSVTNSTAGRTNSANRVPGPTPQATRPRAICVASASSWRNVIVSYFAEPRRAATTADWSGDRAAIFVSRSATFRRRELTAIVETSTSLMPLSLGRVGSWRQ